MICLQFWNINVTLQQNTHNYFQMQQNNKIIKRFLDKNRNQKENNENIYIPYRI